MITFGTRLWVFDGNHRVYPKGGGGPIFSEHFRPFYIIGENRVSWIVASEPDAKVTERGWNQWKVNKKTFISDFKSGGYGRCKFYTDEGRNDRIWENSNRYKIIEKMRAVDVPTLKKIGQLIGYDPEA